PVRAAQRRRPRRRLGLPRADRLRRAIAPVATKVYAARRTLRRRRVLPRTGTGVAATRFIPGEPMKAQNDSTDPQHIYRQLKLGVAHELVNDQNVFELIALAERDGNTLLATELREWQAPCSDSMD